MIAETMIFAGIHSILSISIACALRLPELTMRTISDPRMVRGQRHCYKTFRCLLIVLVPSSTSTFSTIPGLAGTLGSK